jgi:hypothetical protein
VGGVMKNELPERKNTRLQRYDYSQAGYYFITICVKERHEKLGKISVGDAPLSSARWFTTCPGTWFTHIP